MINSLIKYFKSKSYLPDCFYFNSDPFKTRIKKEKLRFENDLFSTDIEVGFNEFLKDKEKTVQKSTYAKESHIILKFKQFLVKNGLEIIKDISPDIIKSYLLSINYLSQKTIYNHIGMINSLIKYFKSKSYLPDYFYFNSDPFKKKIKKEKVKIITKQEARIIIDDFKKINDIEKKAYLLIPFFTGMRFSEVKGLNRKNIDLTSRIITVSEKWTEETDHPESILKSSTAYRKIPIMQEFLPILSEYLETTDKRYIFENLSYNKIKKYYIGILANHNIKFHYHMGRHFFASLLIDSKLFSLKEIQTILGHSSINMTMDIYGHLIQDWNIKTFDKIEF